MQKRITAQGLKIDQIAERHEVFRNLTWSKEFPPSYSVIVMPNQKNTGGIIACSDAFGGGVSWAKYVGKNPIIGKEREGFDTDESKFIREDYPVLWEAIKSLDA